MAKVVIIGGGICGLSAAYELSRQGKHEVTLLESSERLGGKIVTNRVGELLIEVGPDSVFTTKPAAVELMEELGLEPAFIEPRESGFSILTGGKLHAVPRAVASLIPNASSALETIGFLTAAARKRILSESEVPKGAGGDESIASFFRRRFGTHFSKSIAEPLLAGIHAGNAERLSMKALYPNYIGLEQKNGSLSGAAQPTPTKHQTRKPGFLSLRGGTAQLVDTLVETLERVQIRKNFAASLIQKTGGGYVIRGPEDVEADAILICIPAYAAAGLLREISSEAAEGLKQIRHASTAVVTFAFSVDEFPHNLHGNGFLVPADEPCDITGCTYSSRKWSARAPEGTLLLRAFIGQDGGLNIDPLSDETLIVRALTAIQTVHKTTVQPTATHLSRWTQSMPQYDLGHLDRMDEIDHHLSQETIHLAGTSYRGTGIPDCIRQGRQSFGFL